MTVQKFINEHRVELSRVLHDYLTKKRGHEDVHRFLDRMFLAWKREVDGAIEPMVAGEKEFWCAVWSSQHLATEDHWADGVTQRELGFLLKVLNHEEVLPAGYEGRRP